jgi:DNA-binding transcriptional MerR regulator
MGLIQPDRLLVGGVSQRIYDEEHVRLLLRVKHLLDGGYRLRSAFELARAGHGLS